MRIKRLKVFTEFDFIRDPKPGRRFVLRGKPIDSIGNRAAFAR